MHNRTYIAAFGDANDPLCQSGRPYHLAQAATLGGVASGGLTLPSESSRGYRTRRLFWNARRALSGHIPGGFRYDAEALEYVWAPLRNRLQDCTLINCHFHFPEWMLKDGRNRLMIYLDQTLHQLFSGGYDRRAIGDVQKRSTARETEAYHAATVIFMTSDWGASSVVNHYGIPGEKVVVVRPGANLDPDVYADWEATAAEQFRREGRTSVAGPTRLVFVGYEWRRKGLDRLLRAHAIARAAGSDAVLAVIGCHRNSLPGPLRETQGVEWWGEIDKRHDAAKFLRVVSSCQVGCLLSHLDASPISLREFHALGLAVIGPTTGGAAEQVMPEAAVLFDGGASDEEVAATILRLSREKDEVASMCAHAWTHRREFLWSHAVEQFRPFLQ